MTGARTRHSRRVCTICLGRAPKEVAPCRKSRPPSWNSPLLHIEEDFHRGHRTPKGILPPRGIQGGWGRIVFSLFAYRYSPVVLLLDTHRATIAKIAIPTPWPPYFSSPYSAPIRIPETDQSRLIPELLDAYRVFLSVSFFQIPSRSPLHNLSSLWDLGDV